MGDCLGNSYAYLSYQGRRQAILSPYGFLFLGTCHSGDTHVFRGWISWMSRQTALLEIDCVCVHACIHMRVCKHLLIVMPKSECACTCGRLGTVNPPVFLVISLYQLYLKI